MKKITGLVFPVLALISLVLSCHTIQKDLFISGMDETVRADLAALEETIVTLEFAPQERTLGEARTRINSLAQIPDNEFQAFLAAWSGRLYLLEGAISEAQRELRKSQTLSPENWVAAILSSRLERDAKKRLALLDNAIGVADALTELIIAPAQVPEGSGELQIERGRVLLELGRFSETVASFDRAFLLLKEKPYYQRNYQTSRDRAWEFRNIDSAPGTGVLELAGQDIITWRDLIEITKKETDLFRFLTAGRDWPADEIFSRLLERSFIPLTQDVSLTEWPGTGPRPGDMVLRSGAAWFLWRVNAENRANRGLLSRYSSRYAAMPNARSPVADLPLFSPFFDPILGCVESEFMSLPDGRNFLPGERVKGSEFLIMLKKLL